MLRLRFGKKFKDIEIERVEVERLLSTGEYTVLDVRSPEEIATTPSIDKNFISINFHDSDFNEKVKALPKDKKYIVLCSGGIRARGACDVMKKEKFPVVYSVKGGLKEYNK